MICAKVKEQLADYSAGFIQGAAREQLQAHLVACESCRRHLEELRQLDQSLAGERLEAEEELVRAVMTEVRADGVRRLVLWPYVVERVAPLVGLATLIPVAMMILLRLVADWAPSLTAGMERFGKADWAILTQLGPQMALALGMMALAAGVITYLTTRLATRLTW